MTKLPDSFIESARQLRIDASNVRLQLQKCAVDEKPSPYRSALLLTANDLVELERALDAFEHAQIARGA